MRIKFKYLIILLLFTTVEIHSQKVIGLEAGMVFSTLQFEKNDSQFPKFGLGMNLGLNFLYKINNSFDFESGIFYAQKGQRIKSTGAIALFQNGTTAYIEEFEIYKLNYLQLPLKINYNFNCNIFVSCGIYCAYGLGGFYLKKSTFIDTQSKNVVQEISEKEDLIPENKSQLGWNGEKLYKKFDYGLDIGIGYRLGRLSIKSVFDLGLSSAIKITDPFIFGSSTKEFKNRSLSLSIIYYISKKYYQNRY